MLKNDLFASVSERKNIKIWDIKSEKSKRKIMAHKQPIHDLKLLSSGHLASCSADKTIKIWNYESGECIRILREHKDKVTRTKQYHDKWIRRLFNNSVGY